MRTRKLVLRAALAVAAAATAVVAITHAVAALPLDQGLAADPPTIDSVAVGAYTGPAKKGVEALAGWERFSGTKTTYAIDYAAADTWDNVTGPDWSLSPWWGANRRLIYSVPLFPHGPKDKALYADAKLDACAAGAYDEHWAFLGHNLVSHHLQNAIVRPGWEFNAGWYVWAAKGRTTAYVQCFRHLVSAMRSASGQRFQFLWNPALGSREFPAAEAYPGDQYVDYVGVDVYDTSWAAGTYPVPAGADPAAAQAKVWDELLNGTGGLAYWAGWASAHGKRMAIPEWGLSQRKDGHGGGDNVAFIEGMLQFIREPRNDVAFAMYFDADTDAGDHHRISSADTHFPLAAARFQQLMKEPVA